MKRLLLLLVAGAVVALATVASAPGAVQTNVSEPFATYVYVSCGNGGLGDFVYVEGNLHVVITYTFNGNVFSGTSHYQPQGVSGQSLTTGAKYQATGVTRDTFAGSLENGRYVHTYVNNFRIIGQGSAGNYLVHETFHMTYNADGVLTTSVDNYSVDCK